jgi:hypothetical protein
LNGHVHGDAERRVDRALYGMRRNDPRSGLIGEEVHCVRRVVPQQVVRPRARLAERIHVGAAEEIGLHVHLLDAELARGDPPMDPLMRGIEPPGMALR